VRKQPWRLEELSYHQLISTPRHRSTPALPSAVLAGTHMCAPSFALHAPWHVARQGVDESHRLVTGVGGGAEHARAPALDHGDGALFRDLKFARQSTGPREGRSCRFPEGAYLKRLE